MSTMKKEPRTGLLLLLVAVGAAGAGFLAGWELATNARPSMARSSTAAVAPRNDLEAGWEAFDAFEQEQADPIPVPVKGNSEGGEGIQPSELIDALRRNAGSERSQKMLLGMVADAAQAGGRMLPEIKRLLDEGTDIEFKSYDPSRPGYPSLRVALLAVAEATGDPEAVRMIAEVAQTSESPVEVVFSAHMLERLDALDPQTAQRTLDSIAQPLTKEQIKAMASVARRIIPAAARADPDYAATLLLTQLRATDNTAGHPRMLAPVLDGLPYERARNIVLDSVGATDVSDRKKSMLAARAAQRGELKMLQDLRSAIESNTLSPRVSRSIASSAMSGGRYHRMRGQAYRAIKQGDLSKAQRIAKGYESRLAEAARTVQAARATGAKLPRDITARATLYRKQLDDVLARIRHEHFKRQKKVAVPR